MTTIWKRQEPRDRENIFKANEGVFLRGSCYAFAIALHRGLGWPLVGMVKDFFDGVETFGDAVWHAGVRDPKGNLWDVRGIVKEEDFGDPFGAEPPYVLKSVTEKELKENKAVGENEIYFAAKIAQALWPGLPWKKDTLKGRVAAFAEDLERISRKHKIWIRGAFPATLPVLAEGVGDEKGYKLELTDDGMSYTINREL